MMANEEIKNYVRDALASGKTAGDIRQTLIDSGWQKASVEAAFGELDMSKERSSISTVRDKVAARTFVTYAALVCAIIILGGAVFYLWQERLDLADTNAEKVRAFYARLARSQISFTDAREMVFPDEQKFITQKERYIQDKTDFIEANLQTMEVNLYGSGVVKETVKILSKGREKSWWETPTGDYTVLGKSLNGYSSIGNVWMPYSIQFYGNYLIHGWPHYNDGTPVPQGYSGGCVRLSNDDAKKVFDFARSGMPVLVLEDHTEYRFGTLRAKATDASLPAIDAKAFLVTNLSSGEPLLEKNSWERFPVASLAKLMTAVVSHEVIYLGRSIKVTQQMLANIGQTFRPATGERYLGMDLMYPLLMQSSDKPAKILASFTGEDIFIRNMNTKVASLGMEDTHFVDVSGASDENISTARDISKLLQYIYYKRPFLFDISKGVVFENVGLLKIGNTIKIDDLENTNAFIGDPDLIGAKDGGTSSAGQVMVTVWNIHTSQEDVPVAIVVLGSQDSVGDTESLHAWLKNNFETPQAR